MLAESFTLYHKIRRRIALEGLTDFRYTVAAILNYPRNGFPRYGVDEFMKAVSEKVKDGDLMLDAGAGHCPYKGLFSHTRYESCDFMPVLKETGGNTEIAHTFFCDLETIPRGSSLYDAIICNQVFEHVKHPEKVISEFNRILKPGGKLFLTAPQCAGIHMAPYHFFNFTQYGLKLLFEEAGFRVVAIKSLGGIFWAFGKVVEKSYEALMGKIRRPFKPFFLPVHLLIRFVLFIVSFILFQMDKLDQEKGWT